MTGGCRVHEPSYADPIPDLDRRTAYRLTQAQAADLLGVSVARVAEQS